MVQVANTKNFSLKGIFMSIQPLSSIINKYKTLTSVPSWGREGAWGKNKKMSKRLGSLAAPERASLYTYNLNV